MVCAWRFQGAVLIAAMSMPATGRRTVEPEKTTLERLSMQRNIIL
jgi:hypothetical protein